MGLIFKHSLIPLLWHQAGSRLSVESMVRSVCVWKESSFFLASVLKVTMWWPLISHIPRVTKAQPVCPQSSFMFVGRSGYQIFWMLSPPTSAGFIFQRCHVKWDLGKDAGNLQRPSWNLHSKNVMSVKKRKKLINVVTSSMHLHLEDVVIFPREKEVHFSILFNLTSLWVNHWHMQLLI